MSYLPSSSSLYPIATPNSSTSTSSSSTSVPPLPLSSSSTSLSFHSAGAASPFTYSLAPPQHMASAQQLPPTAGTQALSSGLQTMSQTAVQSTLASIPALLNGNLPKVDRDRLRANVPTAKDALLEEISSQNVKALTSIELTIMIGTTVEKFFIYEADTRHQRFAMDQSAFKIEQLLQRLKQGQVSFKWGDWRDNILKTCTSVLSNQDASFCGNEGLLIYLTPKSGTAPIAASAHDVLSPSENPSKDQSGEIRAVVQRYADYQESFKIIADFTQHLVNQCLVTPDIPADMKNRLRQTDRSTFEKRYYSRDNPTTKIEDQLTILEEILKADSSIEGQLNTSLEDIKDLKERWVNFLHESSFIEDGIQRDRTTRWELSADVATHFFHPNQRARNAQIHHLHSALTQAGVLPRIDLGGLGEVMTHQDMLDFLTQNKEQLFKNIILNTLENYTTARALELLQRKRNNEYVLILQQLHRNSSSTDSIINQQVESLKKLIEEENEYAKTLYTEVQFHSRDLSVTGIGLKKRMLDAIPIFDLITQAYKNFSNVKANTSFSTQQKQELSNKILQDLRGRAEQVQVREVTSNGPRLVSGASLIPQSIEDLEAIGKSIDLVLDMMRVARDNGIPLFLHYG